MLGAEMSEQQPMESKPPAPPRTPGGGRRRGRRGGRGRGPRRAAPVVTAGETAAPLPEDPEIQAGLAGEIAAPAPDAPVSEPSAQPESPAKPIEPPIRLQEMPVRPVPSQQKFNLHVPAAVSRSRSRRRVPPSRTVQPLARPLEKSGRLSSHWSRRWNKWWKCCGWWNWPSTRSSPTNASWNRCAAPCTNFSRRTGSGGNKAVHSDIGELSLGS